MSTKTQRAVVVSLGHGRFDIRDIARESETDFPEGNWVRTKTKEVGLCGTDREIVESDHGSGGENVLGHEGWFEITDVGPSVQKFKPGDFVTVAVRHLGTGMADKAKFRNHSSEPLRERGIFESHGHLREFPIFPDHDLFAVPTALHGTGIPVLGEAESVAANVIREIKARQNSEAIGYDWAPEKILVLGAGTISNLVVGSLKCESRFNKAKILVAAQSPNSSSNLGARVSEKFGAEYVSLSELLISRGKSDLLHDIRRHRKVADEFKTFDVGLLANAKAAMLTREVFEHFGAQFGQFDLIVEACTDAYFAVGAMQLLTKNGQLVLTTIPRRNSKQLLPYSECDMWNQVIFTWNTTGIVNAADCDWERGLSLLAKMHKTYPEALGGMVTHKFRGIESFPEAFQLLKTGCDAKGEKPIKIVVEVSA